jgi:UDP-GlcNAc:undecaprenyl-phosphate GlcNAc-1-phosphate transferase
MAVMMFYSYLIFSIGFSVISSLIMINMIKNMLYKANFIRKNYKGQDIPLSVGIAFIPIMVCGLMPLLLVAGYLRYIFIYLFLCLNMSLMGLIDDVFGNRNQSGFKGHIGSLLKGELTTGGFKAAFGGVCALFVSVGMSHNIAVICLNTLIIALFTNLLNLFDLRPGRAVKAFWFFGILLILFFVVSGQFSSSAKAIYVILPIVIGSVLYFKGDVRAEYMMGDAGANVLGCSLGFAAAFVSNMYIKICIFFVLLFLNLLSEKVSFTKLIEKNRLLNKIDSLWR